ncbi:hypothetical protein Tco_1026631, partial [Tanacetum coccineum]
MATSVTISERGDNRNGLRLESKGMKLEIPKKSSSEGQSKSPSLKAQ